MWNDSKPYLLVFVVCLLQCAYSLKKEDCEGEIKIYHFITDVVVYSTNFLLH